jgi:molecular chaperone Hsp33
MNTPHDSVLRAITNDSSFRVITADTTETARAAVRAQQVEGVTARHLAELLCGTVLVRETMAPNLRVQGIVKGAGGRGNLVGDSYPTGGARALAQVAKGESQFTLGEGSLMQIMRTLPNGSIQQGIVDAPPDGGLSQAVMAYLQDSEQVASVVAVGARVQGRDVVRAGGYLVQLLPEVERGTGFIMTQRLDDFPPIEQFLEKTDFSAEMLMDEILYGMSYTKLERSPVHFECRCSETTLLSTLATLPAADVSELVSSSESLEIRCDYCGTEYDLAPERLRALLAQS